jgi:hypothetical protein
MRLWKLLHNEGREKIEDILGVKISFDGHFNKVFDNLKPRKKQEHFRIYTQIQRDKL